MVALLEAKAASMPAAAKATIAPAVLQSYVGRWFLEPAYQWGHSSSPIMYKDTAIVQADQQKGSFIAAYDLKTGKEVWRTGREDEILTAYEGKTVERFYRSRVGGGGAFTASPVAADGKLYLANEDGEVDVVKAGRTFQEITKNEMKDVIMSTPAISGEVLILRTLGHVYGLVEKDQRQ